MHQSTPALSECCHGALTPGSIFAKAMFGDSDSVMKAIWTGVKGCELRAVTLRNLVAILSRAPVLHIDSRQTRSFDV